MRGVHWSEAKILDGRSGRIGAVFAQEGQAKNRIVLWRRLGLSLWVAKDHYLIAIPALLSIIEGVVALAGCALTERKVHLVAICASNSEKSGPNLIQAEMWTSMALFMEKLFQQAPFEDATPTFMNRHWILHGRDSAPWSRAEALRLFNALQTVDSRLE